MLIALFDTNKEFLKGLPKRINWFHRQTELAEFNQFGVIRCFKRSNLDLQKGKFDYIMIYSDNECDLNV